VVDARRVYSEHLHELPAGEKIVFGRDGGDRLGSAIVVAADEPA